MASIQRLKKELSYVTSELLFGCYIAEMTNPKATTDELSQVAEDITTLHATTIQKINDFKRLDKAEQNGRKYFVKLRTNLINTTQEIVEKIEALR
ncbi:MAG: hypothetical protein PHR79_10475 [Bacteroidales bacterium]|nr:hypothetical protein [Bacteroidales bacterium]MDD4747776.1 hypothetical protein [Salinivirgaceae bacterium]